MGFRVVKLGCRAFQPEARILAKPKWRWYSSTGEHQVPVCVLCTSLRLRAPLLSHEALIVTESVAATHQAQHLVDRLRDLSAMDEYGPAATENARGLPLSLKQRVTLWISVRVGAVPYFFSRCRSETLHTVNVPDPFVSSGNKAPARSLAE